MKMTTLIFPNTLALSWFLLDNKGKFRNADVRTRELTLTAMFTTDLIEEAINVYEAQVLTKEIVSDY